MYLEWDLPPFNTTLLILCQRCLSELDLALDPVKACSFDKLLHSLLR